MKKIKRNINKSTNTKNDRSFSPKREENEDKSFVNFLGLCKGCGICIEKCPVKCLKWDKKNLGVYKTPTVAIDIDKCINCGMCELHCPDSAIKVESKGDKGKENKTKKKIRK